MTMPVLIAGAVLAAVFAALSLVRQRNSPLSKPCASCGGVSRFGYSARAEERLENLRPTCLSCLIPLLKQDYEAFEGRAVVVAPVAGLPVYVFQDAADWKSRFPKNRIGEDALALLAAMTGECGECRRPAKYLWIGAHGYGPRMYDDVLLNGLSMTLLRCNPAPEPLCAACCVDRLNRSMEGQQATYIEISGPRDSKPGFVIAMGY